MKKILLSTLFLISMLISSNSFAQTANSCSGTVTPCANRTTQISCQAISGCSFNTTTNVCSGTTSQVCTDFSTNATSCKANGCFFVTSGDANQNAFVETMCNALKIVTGNGGKAFAAFAIISVGIGFFTGKISWGLMIGVTAGIAAMFGAPTIVAAIAGGSALDCGS